ncbi:MFS transporter [Flavimaricola marinus]|uniref:Putative MFS-type transporter YcaD n=1 Tax=Flavimaricola marinus TaxID=1819565 RepID=A0A238LG92_9RHOB|nr:MFS transporter [Flavimaricola marinus]SMY07910.1 putative MFS-type transporter YcaD [Flavimaricola marinus]
MLQVFGHSWALFLGMFMLMIGNGLQGTLLGVRGEIEGFSTTAMSLVMSAYFLGFLFASRMVPKLIQKVGHVRVFAALGSTISAVLILYPALAEPWVWTLGRAIIGFCFCGVYITAESWLNDSATNETRGQALSVYMIVQMAGIVVAQYILTLGDASGFILFIVPSVLVSLAFAPILLAAGNSPTFETTKPLSIRRLIEASPLACMGMFLLGGVFAAQFGMSAVYATRAGLTVPQISVMVSITYVTALFLQYPVGWLSDRMDRRILIIGLAFAGGLGSALSFFIPGYYLLILISAGIVGGMSNPLYALLIAYANDFLEREDMAAASGGLLFVNGVGAVSGPLLVGWAMDNISVHAYWAFIAALMLTLGAYGLWRMTRRATTTSVEDLVSYAPITASASPVMAVAAQEIYIETEEDSHSEDASDPSATRGGRPEDASQM